MSSSETSSLRMALVIHNGEKIVIIIVNAHSFRWITHLTTTVNSIYIISIEWSKTQWGSLVWKPFPILCFLFVRDRLQPPWPSMSLKVQNLTAANQGKEAFLNGSAGKEPACNAADTGDSVSAPGLGRSSGEGNGNSLQYFCLENHMDREACWATVHGVTGNRTWVSDQAHKYKHNQRREGQGRSIQGTTVQP